MESLTINLKEVQKAKYNLESRLNEKRLKRKNIESTLETVNSKLTQVNDIHTKMTETTKIAQHKVAQTQVQSDSMEHTNQEKRETLQSINQQINSLQEQRTNDMHKFEDDLGRIAKQMVKAKDFYTKETLLGKISESNAEYEKQLLKKKQLDEEIANVTQYLSKLEEHASDDTDEDIDKQAVLDTFSEEHNNIVKHLESLDEEIKSARNCLNRSTQG